MKILSNILEAIGSTPIIRLARLAPDLELYGKLEHLNPGGSVKDRIALTMIEEAERRGALAPGGTIVEATAGNTGIGLAMVAAVRGYRCVFVMPEKMSEDKAQLLRAYGATVLRTKNAPPDDPENFQVLARRLAAERGWFLPDQFSNPANIAAHYESTGAEIWADMEGQISAFVCGVGTGGSITGIGRYLKEQNPAVRVICADPRGSTLHGGPDGSYQLEGIGASRAPVNFDPTIVDAFEVIDDEDAFELCRLLARREGLLLGGAAGASLVAALREAQRDPKARVLALLQDSGRNYLSKIYQSQASDALAAYNSLPRSRRDDEP